jgi:hypothetical protein
LSSGTLATRNLGGGPSQAAPSQHPQRDARPQPSATGRKRVLQPGNRFYVRRGRVRAWPGSSKPAHNRSPNPALVTRACAVGRLREPTSSSRQRPRKPPFVPRPRSTPLLLQLTCKCFSASTRLPGPCYNTDAVPNGRYAPALTAPQAPRPACAAGTEGSALTQPRPQGPSHRRGAETSPCAIGCPFPAFRRLATQHPTPPSPASPRPKVRWSIRMEE